MITEDEVTQDVVAADRFTQREQDIESRRRDLASRAFALEARGAVLRAKLAHPQDDAPAELTSELEDIQEDITWIRYGYYQLISDALAVVDEDGDVVDYPYTPADVKEWCDGAVEMGCAPPEFKAKRIANLIRLREVPNAPFRKRLTELLADSRDEEITLSRITVAVAGALKQLEEQADADPKGYGSKHFVSKWGRDATRVTARTHHTKRMLGMVPNPGTGERPSRRLFLTYEQALAFMRVLDMTPHEAGL